MIEQAKGVLAERGGLDMPTAFERLRAHARRHRLRLTDLAGDVVGRRLSREVIAQIVAGSTADR